MSEFLTVCEQAARAGGEVLLHWLGRIEAKEKGPNDLVTEADLAAQAVVKEYLLSHFPDHDFVGEEDIRPAPGEAGELAAPPSKSDYCWVVDPLDGTTNYVHGMPGFAVSIALLHKGSMIAGAVYDPLLKECFSSAKGQGATLNGKSLKTSQCKRLQDALLAVSFAPNVPRGSVEVARFIEGLHSSQAIRRLGSAALNLCYVAAGRLDGYWASSVKIWDVAAGLLILAEAGGIATDFSGGPIDLHRPKLAVSASPELHAELLALLARAK